MISFVTLFARDIERTADVYRLIGFEFVQEQHGSGPRHLAAVNEGMGFASSATKPGVSGLCLTQQVP